MIFILGWIIYGFLVGIIAKAVHPGEDPIGFFPTIGIGIAGSYIGGFLSWMLGTGCSPFSSSGILMGTIGGVIFCWFYRRYRFNRFFKAQGRLPLYKPRSYNR